LAIGADTIVSVNLALALIADLTREIG